MLLVWIDVSDSTVTEENPDLGSVAISDAKRTRGTGFHELEKGA